MAFAAIAEFIFFDASCNLILGSSRRSQKSSRFDLCGTQQIFRIFEKKYNFLHAILVHSEQSYLETN